MAHAAPQPAGRPSSPAGHAERAVPAVQSRVKALAGMRAPLAELEELLEESETLPAVMPEVDSIKVGGWAVQ
jgi:hypothetical protein